MKHILEGRKRVWLDLLLVLIIPGIALADDNKSPHIYRSKIEPHWFADPAGMTNQFWYRLDLVGDAKEFLLVNAATGQRAPAFNHSRLAESLSHATGKPVPSQKLPFDVIEISPDVKVLQFRSGGTNWTANLTDFSLTPVVGEDDNAQYLPALRSLHPSKDSSEETLIRFVNRLPEPVSLFWVDDNGDRQPYGSLNPGETRELHTYVGHVWLVNSAKEDIIAVYDAEALRTLAEIGGKRGKDQPSHTPSSARWAGDEKVKSPDGKWEISVNGDNLFLRDTTSNQITQLTFDAHPEDSYARNAAATRAIDMEYETRDPEHPTPEIYWAQDSRHFVAMRFKAGSPRRIYMVESSPKDQLQPRLVSFPYLKPGDEVPYAKPHLFDAVKKQEVRVTDRLFDNPWSVSDVHWWPDSSEFTFLFNQRGHQVMRLLAVNAASGAVRPIVDEQSKTFICYSSKNFAEYLDETGEIIWMSERDGWNHLYLYDAKTGKVKNQITQGQWVVRGVDRVDHEKRQVWFHVGGMVPGQDPYYIQFCRVNFDGSGLTVMTEGDGTHAVQYSPDGRYLIDTYSRVDLPPVNDLRHADDGKLVCHLEQSDASELTARNWQAPERFIAKGRDGVTDIYGVIFWPKDFDPKKKYPVLEDVYAGPQDSFVPKEFRLNYRNSALTEHGFIVIQADGMGTSNRSKKFHDVCWKNLADAGFPDRILWIKAAAAKYPAMDLSRVGIYGTSAGGQSAMRALLDHNDFYRAAIADSGCHDNRMDKIWWNEQWMGWPLDESYVRSSNVEDAHKLQGKLLLMVGEMDNNVDPATTMQVVDALIKAHKDFELLDMPGMGHGVARTPYGTRRLLDFFTKAFLDKP